MVPIPVTQQTYASMPETEDARREALISVFGEHVFFIRKETLRILRERLFDASVRATMGRLFARPYIDLDSLSEAQKEAVLRYSETAIDTFLKYLLSLFGNIGNDLRLGAHHSLRYKLSVEICDPDRGDNDVIAEIILDRNQQKPFEDYYGRWLNKFGTS